MYIPGSNSRAISKAKTLNADGYIFDLEDAVAPNAKVEARQRVCDHITKEPYANCETIIRINSFDTEWGMSDFRAACNAKPNAILLPMVETNETLKKAEKLMQDYGADKSIKIWAMLETPLGILNAKDIAFSSDRLTSLVMGTSDLVHDLRAKQTSDRLPILTSLCTCILAARAAKVAIIDGVHLNLKDEEGYVRACHQGSELGFDGKSLIHPDQISVANQIFGPNDKDIQQSNDIIDAYTKIFKEDKAVTLLDGNLIENLHFENAKRVLEIAKIISKRNSPIP